MPTKIKSILDKIIAFFRKTDKKKLILLGVTAAVVLITGIIGAVLLNRGEYTVLYSGLSAEEAGTIKSLLDEMGVESKAKGTDTILVPEDQADDLRIQLAADGYPNTGLNYDLFSNSSALGSTDLERQTYLQYQLQENMKSTICKMNKVEDAIVIVNLSNSSSFVLSGNTTEASVAVMVDLEDGQSLMGSEARSIAEFVAKCVPNLKYENISIVDSEMNYYDILSDDEGGESSDTTTTQQELTERMKVILTDQVMEVLTPAVGSNNIAVSVNLALDFDRESTSQVEFSPLDEDEMNGIIRSSETVKEVVRNGTEDSAGGQAGTDSNGVSAPEYVNEDETEGVLNENTSETYNYEINEVRTEIEKAQGTIQNLSVSVLVNSNVEGISDYRDGIENLVANAIGVDPKYITVEMMPFVQGAGQMGFDDYLSQSEETLQQYNLNRLIRIGIIIGAILIAVVLILFFRRLKKKKLEEPELDNMGGKKGKKAAASGLGAMNQNRPAPKLDVEDLLGRIVTNKSDETEVVEELMERYPEIAVQILRTWLTED